MADDKKTYVACNFTSHWSTKEWKWLLRAAQDMQEYGPWQRHQIIVKDIWGAHLRQVEHPITNANAPKLLLAITKGAYVDTMVKH